MASETTSNTGGDSAEALTVHEGAAKLEALFSAEEENESDDAEGSQGAADETSDEPETEEDGEVADDSETDETDETDPDDDDEQPDSHAVTIDGKEEKVTLDELKKGYSRQADYTRKTQALAEKAKADEGERNADRAARAEYLDRITQLDTMLGGVKEPDWDKIRRESPETFADTYAAWGLHVQQRDAVRAERTQTEAKAQADAQRGFDALVAAEVAKLPEAIPEWKDTAVRKKEQTQLLDYAHGLGYSDEQLSEMADHRVMVVLRKAMLYDASKATKAADTAKALKKIETVKTASPGPKASTRPKTSDLTRAKQRLAKTGNVRDAAAAYELMLPD